MDSLRSPNSAAREKSTFIESFDLILFKDRSLGANGLSALIAVLVGFSISLALYRLTGKHFQSVTILTIVFSFAFSSYLFALVSALALTLLTEYFLIAPQSSFLASHESWENLSVNTAVCIAIGLLVSHAQRVAKSSIQRYEASMTELKRKNILIESLIDNIPTAVFLKNGSDNFKVTLWNKKAEEMFELPREMILGKTAHDLWPSEQADLYLAADKKAVKEGVLVELDEEQSITKTRGTMYLHTKKIPLKISDDSAVNLLCICEDITQRRKVSRELEAKEGELRQVINSVPALLGHWDENLTNIFANQKYTAVFELDPQAIKGMSMKDLLGAENFARVKPFAEGALAGKVQHFNNMVKRSDGRIMHAEVTFVPQIVDGKSNSFFSFVLDVTNRIEAEQENKLILEILKIGVWKFNPIDKSLHWDNGMYDVFELSESDFSGHYEAWESCLSNEAKSKAVKELEQALRGEKDFDTVFEIQTKSRGRRMIAGRGRVLRNPAGEPVMMYGINYDVTEQKQADRDREQMAKLLEIVLDNIPSIIFVKDYSKNLTFSLLNRSGEKFLGLKEEDVLGKNAEYFLPKMQADNFIQRSQRVFEGRNTIKIDRESFDTPQGRREVTTHLVPTFDTDGQPQFLIGISNDITEELKIVEERELSAKISLLIHTVDLAIAKAENLKELIENVLPEILKINPWVVVGCWQWDEPSLKFKLLNIVSSKGGKHSLFLESSRNMSFSPGIGLPGRIRLSKQIEFIPSLIEDKNFPRGPVAETSGLKSGAAVPIILEDSVIGVLEVFSETTIELTEQVRAGLLTVGMRLGQAFEQFTLNEELARERLKTLHSAKLASLGEMSAGIAHEIKNPLQTIDGYLELLSLPNQDSSVAKNRIDRMRRACERILKIVDGLRKFSRVTGHQEMASHSLAELIESSVQMVKSKASRYDTPVIVESQTSAMISCDEVEIEQAFVNLLSNAIDAVHSNEDRWVKITSFEESDCLRVRVTDSGKGIPQEIRPRLFDPFFTTKSVGEGTGLGLSITKGILESHGAKIELLQDEPNTCFEIKFKKLLLSNAAG